MQPSVAGVGTTTTTATRFPVCDWERGGGAPASNAPGAPGSMGVAGPIGAGAPGPNGGGSNQNTSGGAKSSWPSGSLGIIKYLYIRLED